MPRKRRKARGRAGDDRCQRREHAVVVVAQIKAEGLERRRTAAADCGLQIVRRVGRDDGVAKRRRRGCCSAPASRECLNAARALNGDAARDVGQRGQQIDSLRCVE